MSAFLGFFPFWSLCRRQQAVCRQFCWRLLLQALWQCQFHESCTWQMAEWGVACFLSYPSSVLSFMNMSLWLTSSRNTYAQLNRLASVPLNELPDQASRSLRDVKRRTVLSALEWESGKSRQRSVSATAPPSPRDGARPSLPLCPRCELP